MHNIYYDILGLHIYEYYSSDSSTSKHTDITGVITSVCRHSTHVRGPVTASLVTSVYSYGQLGHVRLQCCVCAF